MNRLVRSATLSGYQEVARSAGLDPLLLLSKAGIPSSALDSTDALIPADAVCELLEMSATASGVEDFGLRMCESRQLSILGPISTVVQDAKSLRHALAAMIRYLALYSEAALLDIEECGNVFILHLSLMADTLTPTRQAHEMVLGALSRMLRELLGPGWRARRICLTHSAPRQSATRLRVLGDAVTYGHDFNGIVCDRRDLDLVPSRANPGVVNNAHIYLDTMLARTNQSLAERIRRMVFSSLRTGNCSIEQVAVELGVGRRTIHRRLTLEGLTFSAIFDEVRAARAIQYLGQTEQPISYVAEMLGFSMHSAFTRWFRDRFGCSPSDWRARRWPSGRCSIIGRSPNASGTQRLPG
ncbi:HTH-type transcriptional regulator VirS [Cupriavidus yeoncheonensis]|uniref:HTH-type transcriptional regulator VirS n=1 Tax=Cupriavidus yeoncheonensis TaxID=1462994 RepID=A0A916J266_9BURK|nr:AraC family transcriptional regulator [Cupriavidus yeoncheonensis]CAG2158396.1 HTH-type transcriptional regulator VirS [Cupriavidus yeoncheonensis]